MNPMIMILAASLLSQAPDAGKGGKAEETAAERLDFMKKAAKKYRLTSDPNGGTPFALQAEPVFRLGKQYTDVLEGAVFFWLGDEGRPEAAVQIFKIQNAGAPFGMWIHSFVSLSPETLAAEQGGRTVWNPTTPGIVFQPVPDAPRPADSAAQRSRQMRALAQEFRASDDFRNKGWIELRLLPTPIARYGKPGKTPLDGALLALVEGTDPEVFLFLEARPGKDGPEWQYAFAPMTIFPVKGSLRGKAVWELPDRRPSRDPARPYFEVFEKPSRP